MCLITCSLACSSLFTCYCCWSLTFRTQQYFLFLLAITQKKSLGVCIFWETQKRVLMTSYLSIINFVIDSIPNPMYREETVCALNYSYQHLRYIYTTIIICDKMAVIMSFRFWIQSVIIFWN